MKWLASAKLYEHHDETKYYTMNSAHQFTEVKNSWRDSALGATPFHAVMYSVAKDCCCCVVGYCRKNMNWTCRGNDRNERLPDQRQKTEMLARHSPSTTRKSGLQHRIPCIEMRLAKVANVRWSPQTESCIRHTQSRWIAESHPRLVGYCPPVSRYGRIQRALGFSAWQEQSTTWAKQNIGAKREAGLPAIDAQRPSQLSHSPCPLVLAAQASQNALASPSMPCWKWALEKNAWM